MKYILVIQETFKTKTDEIKFCFNALGKKGAIRKANKYVMQMNITTSKDFSYKLIKIINYKTGEEINEIH